MGSLMLRLVKLQQAGGSAMTTEDFIIALFCQVDQEMTAVP